MAVTCPKCGFQQADGPRCERCGFMLARYGPLPARPPSASWPPVGAGAPLPHATSLEDEPRPGAFRRFYRVFRWVALAACLIVLGLILWPAKAPDVQTDPQAQARVQWKVQDAELAVSRGRPYTLQMNEAELNAWMHSNLALAKERASDGGGPAGPGREPTVEEVQSNVRDIKVNLVEDHVRAHVVFNLYGKDLTLQLAGQIFVADGRLRFQPTSGKLGALPIPKVTLDRAVRRLFDAPEHRDKFQLPPEVKDVQVVHGQLVVSYR